MSKQAVITECPHEGCTERHLLRPEQFRVVRGETGKSARGSMKPKFSAEDRRWSQAVRARDGQRCRRCGKAGTQAAHIISRRHKATRHVLDNGLTLCVSCHAWGHANPEAFELWAAEEIGSMLLAELKSAAYRTQKRVPRKVS